MNFANLCDLPEYHLESQQGSRSDSLDLSGQKGCVCVCVFSCMFEKATQTDKKKNPASYSKSACHIREVRFSLDSYLIEPQFGVSSNLINSLILLCKHGREKQKQNNTRATLAYETA